MNPSARVGRRLRRRVPLAAAIGAAVGLAAGWLGGALAFHHVGGLGFTMSLVGGAVFGAIVGALIGGYSSLESPQPSREPSEVERPILDTPTLTTTEHDVPSVAGSSETATSLRCPVCGRGELEDIGYVRPRDDALVQDPESREVQSFSCGHEVLGTPLVTADQHRLSVERRTSEETVEPPHDTGQDDT